MDEDIQLYCLHPTDEYPVLTYAGWAEFNGNHIQLMGQICTRMTLIKNELEPLSEGDDSTDPNLESEEDKKQQGTLSIKQKRTRREKQSHKETQSHMEKYINRETRSHRKEIPQ